MALYHGILIWFSAFALTALCSPSDVPRQQVHWTNVTVPKNNIRGISLGGWLVLEPWITPSLFDLAINITKSPIVDEYTLCRHMGPEAETLIRHHWDTFITKSDIAAIKAMGFNLVRLPIGYWAIQKEQRSPFISGQLVYLDKAIEWCDEYGLQLQIDLHGVPGSQNGFDNSGHCVASPLWLADEISTSISLNVLQYLFAKYSQPKYRKNIHSIEVVNEPFGPVIGRSKIEGFYQKMDTLSAQYGIPIFVHDAFFGIGSWDDFQERSISHVTIDHHFYSIFSQGQIEWNKETHFANTITLGNMLAQNKYSKVVGEFSGALTDCTHYLNGVNKGHRYDGTLQNTKPVGSCEGSNNIAKWSYQKITDTIQFIYLQIKVYDSMCDGWIFWTYKTESAWEWDFSKLVSMKLLPSTVDEIISNKQILQGIY